MDLLPLYPDGFFDLAIVDPPYGHAGTVEEYHGRNKTRFGGQFDKYQIARTGGTWQKKYGGKIKSWDIAPGPDYFRELFRVSKKRIIWGGNYFDLPPSRNFIIWKKLTISESFSMSMVEYAWTDIWGNAKCFEYAPQDKNRFHPTQKPPGALPVAVENLYNARQNYPGYTPRLRHPCPGVY
jgi:site-specific DNA-methyltransferase (adenine-specific)